jgi:hypothetical protein
VGHGSQASLWEQYPTEEAWADKVAQQREAAISIRPRVNIVDALRSSELGNLAPRKQINGLTIIQGRYLQQIPRASSPEDLMRMLGSPRSARADATGLHRLPAHLRAEPLGLLARQTYNAMTNGNRPEREYLHIYRELAAAAREIPEDLRHADSTRAQDIYQAYFIAPTRASFVETPDQFMEFLGLAGAHTQGQISIQELPPDLRSRSLVQLGLQIHRMQADSDTRTELTKQLLAAIDQIPAEHRNPALLCIQRIARLTPTPNEMRRDPLQLVVDRIASPEDIASFYNIDQDDLVAEALRYLEPSDLIEEVALLI